MPSDRDTLAELIAPVCGWWVGPIWKLGGETCVCHLEPGHDGGHECSCGAWFEGCGHPPGTKEVQR
jgi:hypothetical protein